MRHFQIVLLLTSKVYHFQIVLLPKCIYHFQIVLLISTLHAGFRGRGRLGAHETSTRNEGAGSGHKRLVARRAITMNGKCRSHKRQTLGAHSYFLKGYSYKWKNHFFKMKGGYRDGLKHQKGRNKGSLHSKVAQSYMTPSLYLCFIVFEQSLISNKDIGMVSCKLFFHLYNYSRIKVSLWAI